MRHVLNFVIFCIGVIFLLYLVLPNPEFPNPPADAIQSKEPGDSEDLSVRRAYFTNYTREEVIKHYKKEFNKVPTLRLNYPPEEAQTIIRDQTRSTFLEELAHPLRESIYINGFEPKSEKDTITIEGSTWRQKIIIKQVNSNIVIRILVFMLSALVSILLIKQYAKNN